MPAHQLLVAPNESGDGAGRRLSESSSRWLVSLIAQAANNIRVVQDGAYCQVVEGIEQPSGFVTGGVVTELLELPMAASTKCNRVDPLILDVDIQGKELTNSKPQCM